MSFVEPGRPRSEFPEVRSGLDPWSRSELPTPPTPKGLRWIGTVGPGVIVLGLSIGSGEFLLGPAAFVKYGLALLWVTLVAVFLQTVFNTELMRYTLATGEPALTGFMRTRPSSTMWAWFYAVLAFPIGASAWAGNAAGAIFFLFTGRLAGPADSNAVYAIGVGTFLACVAVLLIGTRIERTLEVLNWILLTAILGGFLLLAFLFVAPETWVAAPAGFFGFDVRSGGFAFVPPGADFFLLGAFAAYSGAGGMGNVMLSNWARDKGYGMGGVAGYIPAAFGGKQLHLAHTGFTFTPTAESMTRWRGWWRIVRADQWGVFFTGAMLGMALPAMLYVTFIPAGSEIRGLGMAAALAQGMARELGAWIGVIIALMGAWMLFKTQLDNAEGTTRIITDILWTGSRRVRTVSRDVRIVYYGVLAMLVGWGVISLRLTQPVILLQLGANYAGLVFVIASLHLLYVNTRLLRPELRPPLWRRAALVAMALFYGAFLTLWVGSLL
jgi:hypothetical protein